MPSLGVSPHLGLDSSWKLALHIIRANGTQYGPEVAWSHGPLGFLTVPQLYSPLSTSLALITFSGSVWIAAFSTLTLFLRHLRWPTAAISTYILMVLGWNRLIALGWATEALALLFSLYCISIVGEGGSSFNNRKISEKTSAFIFGIITAIFFLAKPGVSFQIAAISTATTILTVRKPTTIQKIFRILAIQFTSFCLTATFIWVLLGQSFSNLFSYTMNSMEIVSGYSSAMGTNEYSTWQNFMFASYLTIASLYVFAERFKTIELIKNYKKISLFLLILFFAFKHGFVRNDLHIFGFFIIMSIISIASLNRNSAPKVMAVLGFGLSISLTFLPLPLNAFSPQRGIDQSLELSRLVVQPSRITNQFISSQKEKRASVGLSQETVNLLSGEKIHIDPWEVSLFWIYPEFVWASPPIYQSYSSYTSVLDEINANWLRSDDDAPQYILRSNTNAAVDGRYFLFESPNYMLEMSCRYKKIATDGTWDILERTPTICGASRTLLQRSVTIGEQLIVPPSATCQGWYTFTIHGLDTFGQTVQSIVFKDARWQIQINDGIWYRFIPGTASQVHLLPGANHSLTSHQIPHLNGLRIDESGFTLLTPKKAQIEIACVNLL